MRNGLKLAVVAWGISLIAALTPAMASDPALVAANADKLLRTEVPFATTTKASPGRVGDEVFLRRISLDLVGRVPTPEQITAFVLDPSPGELNAAKRDKAVQRLLADSRYGENWGRYWRDVIMFRKTEERAQLIAGPLEEYLVTSLNENKPWSQVATDFITALGEANENGAVGLIVAQQGQPEEVTAEVSRIFLGVQIQCAQCHNHPTDRWKREQFHELAAFFPRVASQLKQETREFSVAANDSQQERMSRRPMMMRRFGTPEHYMPDLKDPQARGTLMTPVLFATGQKLPLGTKDADRRSTLAKWITAPENRWFAKALVNRMWSELCGEGFYEPVDDMGPDRIASAPQTLDYLAAEFAAGGYDVKWLVRTIMATEMYQLPSAPRRGPEEPAFQANVPMRLRADQLFDNLLHVLEASEPAGMAAARGGAGGPYARFGSPRGQFNVAFGYDPSQRRDEIAGSIPQALAMMNSPMINGALRGTGRTMLARSLSEIKDDKGLVQELYLKTLAREPSQSEVTTCLLFVKQVGNRTEAFEDILWGLVNSSEFLHRS